MGEAPGGTPRYWAIVVAAGGGTRMQTALPKQYLESQGKTLVEHSLAAFFHLAWVDGVVAVVAAHDQRFESLAVAREARLQIATGGAARADSVLAGLRRVSELARSQAQNTYVLVHDGARPCVTRADIERLRDQATDENGGLLAAPVTDTVKRAADGRVDESVDRRDLWCAQTPQMFRLDLLRTALEACAAQRVEVTDEAGAMERAGYRPRLVEARKSNLKVTYPEDLALADFWLSRPEAQR